MSVLILNDVHLGVKRVSGTTPATQVELRNKVRDTFRTLIFDHTDKNLIIAGDLFDGFEVDMQEILQTYFILADWVHASGGSLILQAGNHDLGLRSDKLSAFGLLSKLLVSRFPTRVVEVSKELMTFDMSGMNVPIHIIPHCMNQDLFDLELKKALDLDLDPGYVILHANVDNNFAVEADHSLNVEAGMLQKLSEKHTLMFAHEHQARVMNYGYKDVIVMGNQIPTSISDCLAHGIAQKDGRKYAHILTSEGIHKIETWKRTGSFAEIDWTELTGSETEAEFIRVTGSAAATQASEVVSTIAKFRTNSKALVVSNAVQIAGLDNMDALATVNFEQVTSYDVLGELLKLLEPKEQEVVKSLLTNQ